MYLKFFSLLPYLRTSAMLTQAACTKCVIESSVLAIVIHMKKVYLFLL